MSYDVHLEVDLGGPEPAEVGTSFNYTYNVHRMFRLGLADDRGLNGLSGMEAEQAARVVRSAVRHMEEHPDEYAAMNPENGWGDSVSAREWLARIAEECEKYPRATVRVS